MYDIKIEMTKDFGLNVINDICGFLAFLNISGVTLEQLNIDFFQIKSENVVVTLPSTKESFEPLNVVFKSPVKYLNIVYYEGNQYPVMKSILKSSLSLDTLFGLNMKVYAIDDFYIFLNEDYQKEEIPCYYNLVDFSRGMTYGIRGNFAIIKFDEATKDLLSCSFLDITTKGNFLIEVNKND